MKMQEKISDACKMPRGFYQIMKMLTSLTRFKYFHMHQNSRTWYSLLDMFDHVKYQHICLCINLLSVILQYIKYSLPSAAAANRASTSSIKSEPRSSRTSSSTTANNGTSKTSSTRARASNSESTESSTNGQTAKEEEENLDNVLRQLNLRSDIGVCRFWRWNFSDKSLSSSQSSSLPILNRTTTE